MSLDPSAFAASASRTALAVVDIQERLLAAMPTATQERLLATCTTLIRGFSTVGGSIVVTEQYPKGLGPTAAALRAALHEVAPQPPEAMSKVEFDCAAAPGFLERLRAAQVETVVLAGMEAHICVLQTAVGLRRAGMKVWVAEDAIASRQEAHRQSAVRLLEQLGAVVWPVEAILFALLGRAGTPQFKAVSALIK